MAALGAMRAGAGYVTVLAPASEQPILAIKLTEVMTRDLPDQGGHHVPHGADAVLEATARGGALVLGPGIGRSDGALEFAREVARRAELPLVLDADGLNAHAGALESLAARTAPTILTPHAGELARLLDVTSDVVQAARLATARDAARRAQAIVVLKGDDTIVAAPDGRAAVNPLSAPMLATAGTGDVLSGVLGALLAKGLEPFAAAAAGVRLHAAAGRLAGERVGADGVIATDVIAALPGVLA
jgi:NAD(P)H-hydrate epimerase